MAKQICWTDVAVPEEPRVRFFARSSSPAAKQGLEDRTDLIRKLIIEEAEDGSAYLLRLDEKGGLVWKTRHPSVQETRWQAEFEYDVTQEKWNAF